MFHSSLLRSITRQSGPISSHLWCSHFLLSGCLKTAANKMIDTTAGREYVSSHFCRPSQAENHSSLHSVAQRCCSVCLGSVAQHTVDRANVSSSSSRTLPEDSTLFVFEPTGCDPRCLRSLRPVSTLCTATRDVGQQYF
jgi:hypothetical protein